MRDLADVLDRMLAVIPESEDDLRAMLKGIRSSVGYTAPEVMPELWRATQHQLQSKLGGPATTPWHFDVVTIWSGR